MRWGILMSDYGVLLPTFDPMRQGRPPQVTEAARLAEELGFSSVWTGDHLACPSPVLDAPTALMAAGAVTSRVKVGLSVMLLGIRPLAWTAKQLATIQAISGGRLRLGVGIGGEFPQEYEAAGFSTKQRGALLDAALERLPNVMNGIPQDAIRVIEPVLGMPPLLVGGRSDAAIRRAARFADRWLPMWVSPETLARRAASLEEHAEELGRPTPKLSALILFNVDGDRDYGREQSEGHLRGQYGMTLDRVERWTALGDTGAVAELIASYEAVGVDEFVFMPLGTEPLTQYERLAEAIALLGGAVTDSAVGSRPVI
jgi:alkanesulfonate monooxygenase SsuD/methylene tetrahydromethanopterin reductase-like flavin-dependent oxidoreductase (luciferase family)